MTAPGTWHARGSTEYKESPRERSLRKKTTWKIYVSMVEY